DPHKHDRTDACDRFDFTVDAELYDHAMKHDGDDDGLEDQRNEGRYVKMRRILDISLPAYRERQHDGMKGIHVEQRIKPVLVEQHEAHQYESAGQKMRDVEGQSVHLEAPRHEKK